MPERPLSCARRLALTERSAQDSASSRPGWLARAGAAANKGQEDQKGRCLMTSHDASKVSRTGGVLEPCGAAHGRRGGDIAAAAREGARQAVGPRAVTLSKHPAGTPDGRKMSERLKGVESRQESSHWRLPEPLAVCEAHGSDGATIILRRHGNPEGPRLVLSHANGLAADSYFPFWSLLCDRFDLVLYDFRNHGGNPVGDLRTHNIPSFVRDNSYVVRASTGFSFVVGGDGGPSIGRRERVFGSRLVRSCHLYQRP